MFCPKSEQVVSTLVSIYFGSPWLGNTTQTNGTKFYTFAPKLYSILIF